MESNGSVSSYHDPQQFKAEWPAYYSGLDNLEIIIAHSPENVKIDEYLHFIAKHNGIILSRDNLFMLWELFEDSFKKLIDVSDEQLRLSAVASPELLPKHEDGCIICPTLEITKKEFMEYKLYYDWSWLEHPNTPIHYFIFFKKLMHKSY